MNGEGYRRLALGVLKMAFRDLENRKQRKNAMDFFEKGYYENFADVLEIPHKDVMEAYYEAVT